MKNINWSGRPILLASLAIAAGCFVLGIGFVLIVWPAVEARHVSPDLWSMIGALSQLAATALVLGAAIVAYRELTEVAAGRHLEVADRLLAELNSDQNIAARRWILQNLPDDPEEGMTGLPPEGRDAMKRVLNSLDRVAFLVQPGWIPEEMIMPWLSVMVVKAWTKLLPYVEYERLRRREPDYYRYAQNVSDRCVAWRAKHVPDARLTWIKDAL